ncbi:MAG: hypothetical protein NW241_17470 [Bacteroidia bacterium]|nr:hypothetical protein [Bacteroidia bacterium]
MNRTLYFWPVLALCLTALAGCIDEYPEGPLVSPLPHAVRVVNTWRWSYALENGLNRTGERADSTIQFTQDRVVKICEAGTANCREGKWELVRKNQKLNLIFGEKAFAYDILLLREFEMWLSLADTAAGQSVDWELRPYKAPE